jgi:nucleoside-diphosphate-sugar epimerase
MSIYNAWAIEYSIRGLPYEINCEPGTRCPALYYKDAAMALRMLSAADPSRIETRIYNIAGIAPPFSAAELVDTIEKRIPGSRLSFNSDPVVVGLLRELGALKISEECARKEWDWKLSYPLAEMVDDFIREFRQSEKYYQ